MFVLGDVRARSYFVCFVQVVLILLCVINDSEGAYKIAHGTPVPVMKNAPYLYRGQVFILREIDEPESTFVAEIVNGGIEMVMQPPKSMPFNNYIRKNDSVPDMLQEDPEYLAVLVTTETAALAQISRSTVIKVPLGMLLTGITKRMPWVLVLKRKNHFEYFKNLELQLPPIQVIASQRRRSRSSSQHQGRTARFVTDSQQFDLLYSDKDKVVLQNICANVIEELAFMTSLLQQYSSDLEPIDLSTESSTSAPATATNKTFERYVLPVEQSFEKYMTSFDEYNKHQKNTETDRSIGGH